MLSIDRFEGDFALCEDENRKICALPRSFLPENAKEGDLLEWENGVWSIKKSETVKRQKALFSLLQKLNR